MPAERFKKTQDNWFPNYRDDVVRVTFHGNIGSSEDPCCRVSVWGEDDCGMEYDCDTESEAWNIFLQVINMKYVNKAALKEMRFMFA